MKCKERIEKKLVIVLPTCKLMHTAPSSRSVASIYRVFHRMAHHRRRNTDVPENPVARNTFACYRYDSVHSLPRSLLNSGNGVSAALLRHRRCANRLTNSTRMTRKVYPYRPLHLPRFRLLRPDFRHHRNLWPPASAVMRRTDICSTIDVVNESHPIQSKESIKSKGNTCSTSNSVTSSVSGLSSSLSSKASLASSFSASHR